MRRGQTAMEYLMTYGWALLIIAIVIVALWAMGVFKLGAPTGATGFQSFRIVGFDVNAVTDDLRLTIGNMTGKRITLSSITVSMGGTECGSATPGTSLSPGATTEVTISVVNCGCEVGDTFSFGLTITWTDPETGYVYTDRGTISGVCHS